MRELRSDRGIVSEVRTRSVRSSAVNAPYSPQRTRSTSAVNAPPRTYSARTYTSPVRLGTPPDPAGVYSEGGEVIKLLYKGSLTISETVG